MYATYTSHPLLLSVHSFALFSTSSPASHSKGLRNITRSLHVWSCSKKCARLRSTVFITFSRTFLYDGEAHVRSVQSVRKIFWISTKPSSESSAINICQDHKKSEQKIVLIRRCWVSTCPNPVFIYRHNYSYLLHFLDFSFSVDRK